MLSLYALEWEPGWEVGGSTGVDSGADMLPIKMEDHTCLKIAFWAGEMAKWYGALAALPGDLDSRLNSHMIVHSRL